MTEVERMLPLYEGKTGRRYDHRAASFYGVRETDLVQNADHSFAHGDYRTKRLILEIYDAMAETIETGVPYGCPFEDLLTEDQLHG